VASIYICAFEILKESIIGRIKGFFTFGFDENGPIVDEKYNKEVLSRNSSPVYASLSWLEEVKAIDNEDVEVFEKIKKRRNDIAHELMHFLPKGMSVDTIELLGEMVNLLYKVEVWWIVNVEIATDPDLVGKEFDENGIMPGPVITFRLLIDIALGTGKESDYYFKEFRKRFGGN
jgi:hypothetical protein